MSLSLVPQATFNPGSVDDHNYKNFFPKVLEVVENRELSLSQKAG